mmetsp:Transcript_39451/g.123034  ORF Transcript_39451/g.123034 Transcript_39451/m.123034 type:complete len:137 (+) Transcript_39451:767-1177(+)
MLRFRDHQDQRAAQGGRAPLHRRRGQDGAAAAVDAAARAPDGAEGLGRRRGGARCGSRGQGLARGQGGDHHLCGPASVAKSVEALALARNYVRANGFDLCFYPGFETIIFQGAGPGSGEQRSSVRIHAWPENLAAG